MRPRAFLTTLAIMGFLLNPFRAALAADINDINYAYAVVFGTGAYKVKDQTAFVLELPLAYELRESTPHKPGISLLYPVLAGFYDYGYENILQADLPGDAASTSFVPGVQLEYQMNPRWDLQVFGQYGIGRDHSNDESARVYAAGVKSYYRIPHDSRWRFALGNSLTLTGYDADIDGDDSMAVVGVGIDAVYPWEFSLFDRETTFTSYVAWYWYLDNPRFDQGGNFTEKVPGELEWGLALGFEQPPKFIGFEIDRIGVGFRYGNNIKGVRLITQFPF